MRYLLFILCATGTLYCQQITRYTVTTGTCSTISGDSSFIAIRSFSIKKTLHFLTVNPLTLGTTIRADSTVKFVPLSWLNLQKTFAAYPYCKVIAAAGKNRDSLQNAGIGHMDTLQKGVVLSVDMCPSQNEMDRHLFEVLIDKCKIENAPVPVALSVSGRWMRMHAADFAWIESLTCAHTLAVTWVNHTYRHRYCDSLPINQNFLLEKGTDIRSEVLLLEKELIRHKIVPTIFFRFPGLISSPALVDSVLSYGLIPIGSDAWLGKNQKPKNGSIVLIHGNGNEPVGVDRFIRLLKEKKTSARGWKLLDLREQSAEYGAKENGDE